MSEQDINLLHIFRTRASGNEDEGNG